MNHIYKLNNPNFNQTRGGTFMAYELREKSGSVFTNNFKKKETHPDYTGDILVNGVPSTVALWKRSDRNGKEYFGVSISDKRVNNTNTNTTDAPPPKKDGMPF
jgi:uncharacterized protein (DUF736 family)